MKEAPALAARRIIAKFGGPASLARALSMIEDAPVPSSTVQSWQNVGIPVKWHHPIILAGARAAIPIVPDDFFEPIREAIEAAQ